MKLSLSVSCGTKHVRSQTYKDKLIHTHLSTISSFFSLIALILKPVLFEWWASGLCKFSKENMP